ncbi:YqgE/AlgH family protein [uncultured Christiangramia sp.]|uniref:YqgE/AlgH family protein n=1 Tax=uncultured Christiangramia sp. TaxID=503836 RepID=UPI0025F0DF48|nr:YqgE/AlgH family protein [uncultured Christiangramia sp.]|tara:strand:+ start:1004 stop:1564 length:561 start_codon:yes stop_codon:yes gene_type:complete
MIALKPTKGHLLVAEPSIIGDVSFNRSVVLLADHSENGSVGFILNKILDFTLKDLIPEIKGNFDVYNGGPVEQDNLYFIHKIPDLIPDSIEIAYGIYWGGNFEAVMELISKDLISDKQIKFFLGYSGWDAQQLDDELNSHSWVVTANEDNKDLLEKPYSSFWKDKMLELGGEYMLWSNSPENPSYN